MFQVDAVLTAPDIHLKPPASECHNIIIHSVKDFLERFARCSLCFVIDFRTSSQIFFSVLCYSFEYIFRLKHFSRWMNGTCKPVSSMKDAIGFSFFEDVIQV